MEFSDEIIKFLKEPHYMILSTLRKDTTIQMSVVWYEFTNNTFLVSTTMQRAKYKNISRNSNVSFIILNKNNPYQFIQVRGTATVSDGKNEKAHALIDHLSELYTGQKIYAGDPEHKEDRVVITITPTDFVARGF